MKKVGLLMVALLVAGFVTTLGTAFASTTSASHTTTAASSGSADDQCGRGGPRCDGVGFTDGWYEGRTVDFLYTKNFFCKQPPTSASVSGCEAGANFQRKPSMHFDPLYVVTPIGFTPAASTLQCPVAGKCVDHPHHIDLSRVLGAGTGNALLPPHSHIISDRNNNKPEWWDVVVIGVTTQSSWDKIVAGKSLDTVRRLQAANNGVTVDIPSNLFLFFQVRPGGDS